MSCSAIPHDLGDIDGSLDETRIGDLTTEQLFHELAHKRYQLYIAVSSDLCDCPATVKPWKRELGSGCQKHFENLITLSESYDRHVKEFNERSIPLEKKAATAKRIQKQWPEEMDESERKFNEGVLEELLNETELSPGSPLVKLVAILHPESTECDLNEADFDREGLDLIEKSTGLDFPEGAKGLRFRYKPPIDPIVFAKIEIPADSRELIAEQIGALTLKELHFPKDFANDICEWWPSTPEHVLLSRLANNKGYYIEIYLVTEEEHLILYIKYFTI